jgi:hypothetical protein
VISISWIFWLIGVVLMKKRCGPDCLECSESESRGTVVGASCGASSELFGFIQWSIIFWKNSNNFWYLSNCNWSNINSNHLKFW